MTAVTADAVKTILGSLASWDSPVRACVNASQRLGYLLERIDAGKKASALKTYVHKHARLATVLLPTATRANARRDDAWNLYVNADVEAET